MENKKLLEIGDTIKRWEVSKEMDIVYTITSLTKTLAKTANGKAFFREINYNITKPMDHYLGEVKFKGNSVSNRYFITNK